jgi:hypothetical protein
MSDSKSTTASAADGKDEGVVKARSDDVPRAADCSTETTASSDHPRGGGIDSLFDRLEIGEDEFDDLIIEEADVDLEVSTRWLAVARVHCEKGFSHDAFFQQMRAAWNPAKEISIRPVGINRFVIQCFCLGDWEKVTERGPWLFRDWAVIIAAYDGVSDPESVELEFMPIWIQVHKIPEAYRKQAVVRTLVSRQAGEVITVQMQLPGGFRGDYVRVRIRQDVRKALTRFVSVSLGGKRSVFAVKYEKLGMLCFACGLIGHVHKECGIGVFEDKDLKYGDWINANPGRGRGSGPPRGGTRAGRGYSANGGGRGDVMDGTYAQGRGQQGFAASYGRGTFVDWRQHPERNATGMDRELEDTATSPSKVGDLPMTDAEKNAKKRLTFDQTPPAGGKTLALTNAMHVDGIPFIDQEGEKENKEKDKKRYKKEDGTSVSGQSHGSAASFEDDRRVQ